MTLEATGGMYRPPTVVLGKSDDEGTLVETALGLEKGRTEAPVGMKPWLQGSASETLVLSSKLYGGNWTKDLAEMTNADLEHGRECWLQLRQLFGVIRDMREIYGDDVFGLGALADGYALAGQLIDALAVFVVARDARGENLLGGPNTALAEVCAQWEHEVSGQLSGLRALRAFPPTADLFSTRRLRPTLIDAVANQQWQVEAREVGVRYQSEIAELMSSAGHTPGVGI